MGIEDFLNNLGMQKQAAISWQDIMRPSTVSVILGKKGSGKSALAYYITEWAEQQYDLIPVVVNLPRDKQSLLSPHFVIKSLPEVKNVSNASVIIDEGTTMLPAGGQKLEELVKGFCALSRQRNQLILFIFHASSDAGSRILRGVDNVLLKEPSMRQIQHGAKDDWWREILVEAKEEFKKIRAMAGNPDPTECLKCHDSTRCPTCPKEFTFVDSEEPEFRGVLKNPLASFWSQELSCAWGSSQSSDDEQLLLGVNITQFTKKDKGRLLPSDKFIGQPAKQELGTEDRLTKYGLSHDEFENAIEMDRQYNLEELRRMCSEKGLPVSGDKKRLIANLLQYRKEHHGE